jgi:hypothetical protein
MHAALCIPSIIGAWLHEGGGGAQQRRHLSLEQDADQGLDVADPKVRMLDQSRGPGSPATLTTSRTARR